ncbi:dynein regulatory complex subunit 5-like isoform X2 [Solea solea]|uniref:dynein regulatory complex subunit 5-like isoform X2 n=1 Tax=Solea solea TaxID=90069 RepID=UPI00272D8450|nr:dynein regulatory complex subunit 5-like isoform X2 [Solea solea]
MPKSCYPPGSNLKAPDGTRKTRTIIAEDPHWTLALVPRLSNLCLQSIASNFEENPIFEPLTPSQRHFIQERLSPSLPLHVTANLISDGVYWKRCCERRWDLCDVSLYGHSWKRMFFERCMENMIELFIPDVTETKTILDMVPHCRNYVKRLDICQLLTPVKEPQREEEEELASEHEYEGPSVDHFDFGILLDKLTSLEELHLVYRVKQCGMNFEWKMFEMTDRDCESLAKALMSCKTLKLLRLHQSHIEDNKCRLLVKHLLDHPSLKVLDFSHNLIGDRGARGIGKLLSRGNLEVLNLCDNVIRDHGAKAIAHALSKNSTLLSLNLRLNRVRDEGGQAIGEALLKNNTLCHLHLGGNEVTAPTAVALSEALAQKNILKSINLSCNNLGEAGGKALQGAMSLNTSVTECDLRLTEIDEQIVAFINQVVWTNESLEQERRAREKTDKFLHLAIIHEDDLITQHLIDLFPKEVLDIQNNLYQSPLHLATYLNLIDVVKSLVWKGASLELQDRDGNTALHVACQHGQNECANEMTWNVSPSKLAPVLEIQNWRGLACLHLAALNRQHLIMTLLMKKGADLNIQEGTSGKTALHLAVELHDIASVKLLLSRGANVDAAMFNGCTPLHLAVGRQDAAIANLLCQAGADTMLRNMEDETALDLADGNDDILALFPFDDIQISGRSVVGVKF